MKAKITWKTVKTLAKHVFAPLGDVPTVPDHPPKWVLRDGVPDLCCDKHGWHPSSRRLFPPER